MDIINHLTQANIFLPTSAISVVVMGGLTRYLPNVPR